MLEYDDSAFYYFSIAVLTSILIPFTWSILSAMIWGDVIIVDYPGACKAARSTALVIEKRRQARAQVYNRAFYTRILIAAFLWYVWYLNAQVVSTIETLQSFDPFAILELENDATPRDIKKQYRKMSLEKHPDKNPDDPLAVQEFIKLTKAYNVSILPLPRINQTDSNSCFLQYANTNFLISFSAPSGPDQTQSDSLKLAQMTVILMAIGALGARLFVSIDLDGRDCLRELQEVRQPRRTRQLQRGYCAATVPARHR